MCVRPVCAVVGAQGKTHACRARITPEKVVGIVVEAVAMRKLGTSHENQARTYKTKRKCTQTAHYVQQTDDIAYTRYAYTFTCTENGRRRRSHATLNNKSHHLPPSRPPRLLRATHTQRDTLNIALTRRRNQQTNKQTPQH